MIKAFTALASFGTTRVSMCRAVIAEPNCEPGMKSTSARHGLGLRSRSEVYLHRFHDAVKTELCGACRGNLSGECLRANGTRISPREARDKYGFAASAGEDFF